MAKMKLREESWLVGIVFMRKTREENWKMIKEAIGEIPGERLILWYWDARTADKVGKWIGDRRCSKYKCINK